MFVEKSITFVKTTQKAYKIREQKRQSVYNYIFQHRFQEIEPDFDILGYFGEFNLKNQGEPYHPNTTYDYFSVKLKLGQI